MLDRKAEKARFPRGIWGRPWLTEKSLRTWCIATSVMWGVSLGGSVVLGYQDPAARLTDMTLLCCVVLYATCVALLPCLILRSASKVLTAVLPDVWAINYIMMLALALANRLLMPRVMEKLLPLQCATFLLVGVLTVMRLHDLASKKIFQACELDLMEKDKQLHRHDEAIQDLKIRNMFRAPCRISIALPGIRATTITVPEELYSAIPEDLLNALAERWLDEEPNDWLDEANEIDHDLQSD